MVQNTPRDILLQTLILSEHQMRHFGTGVVSPHSNIIKQGQKHVSNFVSKINFNVILLGFVIIIAI